MAIDWNAEVVDQLESHWRQRLRPRLDGLTDDEYFWRPVGGCWTLSRRGESSAPISFGTGEFTMAFCYAGTAREALRQLDDEYEIWISGVRGLGTTGLAQPQGDPPAFAHAPLAKKMLYVNVEVIHHGAEICLLRDLYLRNGSDTPQP